jgi:hypothetical protein
MTVTSGDFVEYGGGRLGLALRTASNTHGDGSTTDYVEVVPLDGKVLLLAENVRKFGEPDEPDGSEVKESTSSEVTGISHKGGVSTRPKTGDK